MKKSCFALLCMLLGGVHNLFAQVPAPPEKVVYLFGNTATSTIPDQNFALLRQELLAQKAPFTVIHLGDFSTNGGNAAVAEEQAKIGRWHELLQGTNGDFYLVPGDKDWANSGQEGQEAVKQLETTLEQQWKRKKVLLPAKGCPGPAVLDLDPNLRVIAINSQWWMHPNGKPGATSTECRELTREEVVEELQDAIRDAGNRNVLIVGHHPILSSGVYGGRMPLQKHIFPLSDKNPHNRVPLPVFGSMYAAYRQNVGTPRDMAYEGYQNFINDMKQALYGYPAMIYASAHEYNLQLHKTSNYYQIVSGALAATAPAGKLKNTRFKEDDDKGFVRLEYYPDGSVYIRFLTFSGNSLKEAHGEPLYRSPCMAGQKTAVPANVWYNPCPPEPDPNAPASFPTEKATVTPGPEYHAGNFKRFFFGDLYRDTWTTPAQITYLRLDTVFGGLTPTGIGGGRQTLSLEFKAGNGRTYVFRSVNKDPEKALPPELRNTFVEDVVKDMMATGHPYGAVAVSSLLDSTDIRHAQPKLYVMPDNRRLGIYRETFAGKLGMLEEKPQDPDKTTPGFEQADDVKKTYRLFRALYKDNDNRVDARSFAEARAFDIFIGDWGRHEDNWRWAGYNRSGGMVYYPIPRDRDHAFSSWNGLFPWFADRPRGVPGIQNFDDDYDGIRSLVWPARHLDRMLLTSLNRQEWQEIARNLQARMDDATIDAAVAQMPPEIKETSSDAIARRLKKRREHLPEAIDKYYLLLAQEVDVLGSNKHEYFKVERLPEGNVRVRVFKKKKEEATPTGEPFFDRVFVRDETEEIRLYGLGGQDIFDITGDAGKSIRVRVIGGEGEDMVQDNSHVGTFTKYTSVYDDTNTSLTGSGRYHGRLSDEPGVNYYDRRAFEYDYLRFSPAFFFNRSDGFGASLDVGKVKQGFRKPDYHKQYGLRFAASDNGLFTASIYAMWRYLFGKWDGGLEGTYGNYFRYYDFFGLGNDTKKDDDLFKDDFYRARYRGVHAKAFLNRKFWQQSSFRIGPVYERYNTDFRKDSYIAITDVPTRIVEERYEEFGSIQAELDLDFRDKRMFTRRGIRLYASHASYIRLNENKNGFGLTEGFAEYAGTARIGLPVTLVLRGGGGKNYGNDLPFYKYTSLGLRQHLRGYVRNRFTGDASLFGNTELRIHLGQARSQFLPFYYGVLGFFDRGRVWFEGRSPGGWHDGYGGGFYLAPLSERFAFTLLLQHSEEESLMLQVAAGFRIDY